MAKKILCIVTLMFAISCALTSCSHEHDTCIYELRAATCTQEGLEKAMCIKCGEEPYWPGNIPMLEHNEVNGVCTMCGLGVKFILPQTRKVITTNGDYVKKCKIENIKTERLKGAYPCYELTFIIESMYHEKGDSYSDNAEFAWKLYDEDDCLIQSGRAVSDKKISVGEKSKATIHINTDSACTTTYTLKIFDIK